MSQKFDYKVKFTDGTETTIKAKDHSTYDSMMDWYNAHKHEIRLANGVIKTFKGAYRMFMGK